LKGTKTIPFTREDFVRALALRQYIHHPNRLRYPMKRLGERGKNKWARISWDEAMDTCEHRLREIRDRFGAESMVFGQGTGRDSGGPIIFLAYAYGSPNWTLLALSRHSFLGNASDCVQARQGWRVLARVRTTQAADYMSLLAEVGA
jgi:anaerobic selenocysteine-containing dehydrogenase